jgi:hypothetical protein
MMRAVDRRKRVRAIARITVAMLTVSGCAPRAGRLTGAPVPARFPSAELTRGNRRIVFRWDYVDQALAAKGEGLARVSAPDSVRMDFFLDGGLGGGYAIVIGDSVSTPGGDQVRRYLPPVALLWAALGRLAVPAAPDTVAKVDGNALRADIGRNPVWRVTFTDDHIARLERIVSGKRLEWVARNGQEIRYQNERSSRSLTLTISGSNEAPPFDPAIWRR